MAEYVYDTVIHVYCIEVRILQIRLQYEDLLDVDHHALPLTGSERKLQSDEDHSQHGVPIHSRFAGKLDNLPD